MNPRPVHFEIHADNPTRAIKFYRTVFAWKFKKFSGSPIKYWLVTTGKEGQPGINGGLHPRIGPKPPKKKDPSVIAYVCTMGVNDVDAYTKKATKAGGHVCEPKMPIRGFGWLVYMTDTEGNIFGMMESDPKAK